MQTSTSNALDIASRLLAQARQWGRDNGYDQGILFYHDDGTWQFSFWNSHTKQERTELPVKIAHAFSKYRRAIDAYVAHRLDQQKKWQGQGQVATPTPPPASGSSWACPAPDQKRDGGDECDCHGESRFQSPIKTTSELDGGRAGNSEKLPPGE